MDFDSLPWLEKVKIGCYVPTFMFKDDEIILLMGWLMKKTPEEALNNIKLDLIDLIDTPIALAVHELGIMPTGRVVALGKDDEPFTFFPGKLGNWKVGYISGRSFDRLMADYQRMKQE